MSKTETFNELAKAAPQGQILFDIGHLTAQLRKADQESMKELSGTIKPLAEAMASLVQDSSRQILQLGQASNTLWDHVETIRHKLKDLMQGIEERKEMSRRKAAAITLGLSVISSIATANIFCVWQSQLSTKAKNAKNWEAFESQVWPQLSQRERDTISRGFESSSKR